MNNTNNNNNPNPRPSSSAPPASDWDVVYQYTRSQAIADGFQIEVTKTAHRLAHD
jgi:hypothetical protein